MKSRVVLLQFRVHRIPEKLVFLRCFVTAVIPVSGGEVLAMNENADAQAKIIMSKDPAWQALIMRFVGTCVAYHFPPQSNLQSLSFLVLA